MKIYELGLDDIDIVLHDVYNNFTSGIVILRGDLAAGKTTFVKEIVKKYGVTDIVTSPTFSLQQCYGENIFHYDIYNHGLEHFISLGMLEELDKEGLHFVEWGDDALKKILDAAQMNNITIDIKKVSKNKREYRVEYA